MVLCGAHTTYSMSYFHFIQLNAQGPADFQTGKKVQKAGHRSDFE